MHLGKKLYVSEGKILINVTTDHTKLTRHLKVNNRLDFTYPEELRVSKRYGQDSLALERKTLYLKN